MARTFPYRFKENYPSVECIYKIVFGTKYYIVKAKALRQSVNQVTEDIDRRIRLGIKDTDILFKVVKHIQSARVTSSTVEVLFQSENHGELMNFEKILLQAAESDPKCLNISFVPYQPKWISQKQLDEFKAPVKKKKSVKLISVKSTPIKDNKMPSEPKSLPQIDLSDLSGIMDSINKINATKDPKTRN